MALTTGIAVMDAHRRDILQPEVGQVSRHLAANVVQRQAELVGHGLHGVGEHRGCLPHSFSVAVVAGPGDPAKFVLVGVGCPQADVERLGDPQVVDLPTGPEATVARYSAQPGLIPLPKRLAFPLRAASSRAARAGSPQARPVRSRRWWRR